MQLYKFSKSEESISRATAIFRIVATTVFNILFMYVAFIFGAAGTWQSGGKGIYLIGFVCFAPIVVSIIFSVLLYRRGSVLRAISTVRWVIPSFFLMGIGIVIFGEVTRMFS